MDETDEDTVLDAILVAPALPPVHAVEDDEPARGSLPNLACNSFKSTVGAATVSDPKTPPARISNWFFKSTNWLAYMSRSMTNSASGGSSDMEFTFWP